MRWILLRGLGREAGHWGGFADWLRGAFPGAAVDAPDLPGCGALAGAAVPLTVAGMVDAVRAQVTRVGPAHLLALSLGGMVAYEWARRHGDELAAVVYVNSSLGGLSPPWRRLRPSALATLLNATRHRGQARERLVFALTSARPELAEATVAAWVELAARRRLRTAAAVRQLVAAARYRPAPLASPPPALVLASAGDRMVDPACSSALARALHAPLRLHPTAGHDLPLDDPAWVVAQLGDWLTRDLAL